MSNTVFTDKLIYVSVKLALFCYKICTCLQTCARDALDLFQSYAGLEKTTRTGIL